MRLILRIICINKGAYWFEDLMYMAVTLLDLLLQCLIQHFVESLSKSLAYKPSEWHQQTRERHSWSAAQSPANSKNRGFVAARVKRST